MPKSIRARRAYSPRLVSFMGRRLRKPAGLGNWIGGDSALREPPRPRLGEEQKKVSGPREIGERPPEQNLRTRWESEIPREMPVRGGVVEAGHEDRRRGRDDAPPDRLAPEQKRS